MRWFLLYASIVVFFLAGSSAPTPLYPVYQASWGFTPVTVTVVFGIYALAVLATLLVVGSLSDHVGRRPVLLAATLVQAAAMVIFASAHGVGALVAARIVQGLATGAAAGAAGAGMIDVDRERGMVVNGVVPMVGTGLGSMLSGLFVQYLPGPTSLVYLVLGAIFLLQFAGVLAMPESATRRRGALASLRPRLNVPARLRGAVLLVIPALVGAWALVGFYGSLGPSLVRTLTASRAPAIGGLPLFVLAGAGVLAVVATQHQTPRTTMVAGTTTLAGGVAVTLHAVGTGSIVELFVGTALAGAGFGATFQGAIRSAMSLTEPSERAGVLSVLYLVCYLAMGVPAVLAGLRAVHGGGILTTTKEYGSCVIVLAAAAAVGALLRERRDRASSPARRRLAPRREPRISRV
ncbi:MAG TPA: MFS transporter [Polyangiaceae bacterium]|jgi:MFS family permease